MMNRLQTWIGFSSRATLHYLFAVNKSFGNIYTHMSICPESINGHVKLLLSLDNSNFVITRVVHLGVVQAKNIARNYCFDFIWEI